MFSSRKRRSASLWGRREFNGSGRAVTGKRFKRANNPAANEGGRQFIGDNVRGLTPKILSARDTDRLHACTADASRRKPELRSSPTLPCLSHASMARSQAEYTRSVETCLRGKHSSSSVVLVTFNHATA